MNNLYNSYIYTCEALKSAGFTETLNYHKSNSGQKRKRPRRRKITWFNPPFSETIKTNVAAAFLSLIDKYFKGKELGKYFNRATVKVSYSCMPNLDVIIAGNNKQILKKNVEENTRRPECNCRVGTRCPIGGKCLKGDIVYEATVLANNTATKYIGQASTSFKERYRNHTLSFRNEIYKLNTTLSKHIWDLKCSNTDFEISWAEKGQAPSYNTSTKSCKLCLLEKTTILLNEDDGAYLNKRGELMSKCRHRTKFLLSSVT